MKNLGAFLGVEFLEHRYYKETLNSSNVILCKVHVVYGESLYDINIQVYRNSRH